MNRREQEAAPAPIYERPNKNQGETRAEYVTGMLKFGCCHAITAAKLAQPFWTRFSEIYQNLKNKLIAPPRLLPDQMVSVHGSTRRSVKDEPTYSALKRMDSLRRQFMSESLCASAAQHLMPYLISSSQ